MSDAVEKTASWLAGEQPDAATDVIEPDYAIVEVFGHRRHVGRVQEIEKFGAKMLRVDVPTEGDWAKGFVTHVYGGAAIFCITPTDAETVRKANAKPEGYGQYRLGYEAGDPDFDEPKV